MNMKVVPVDVVSISVKYKKFPWLFSIYLAFYIRLGRFYLRQNQIPVTELTMAQIPRL